MSLRIHTPVINEGRGGEVEGKEQTEERGERGGRRKEESDEGERGRERERRREREREGVRGEGEREGGRERGREGGEREGEQEAMIGIILVGSNVTAAVHLCHGQLVEAWVLPHFQSSGIHPQQGIPTSLLAVSTKLYLSHFVAEVGCKETASGH